jgi:glycosyltransferase involved in cell wall biosynthesis
MKVSVIIATYKRPHYLKEAIDSVLSQSFRDFELIIVNDDPSGQETDRIVSSCKDPRIVYIRNEKNLKGAKSLNIGLNSAMGEYVAVLDDDDSWVSKDKLEKQVSFLEKNPDYSAVGTGSIVVDGDSGREITRFTGNKNKETGYSLLMGTPFAHSSVLYRKDIALSVGGYSEDLPRAKDMDFFLKIAESGKIGFLPECFIKYREISSGERNVIKTRFDDLFFQRKVLLRHKSAYPHFWRAYLSASAKYAIFSVLRFIPFPYYLYKKAKRG